MRSRISMAIVLACALTGCGGFVETKAMILAGVPSPDGASIAYAYRTEPWGGVLADFSYRVSILSIDSLAKPWEEGEIVWTAEELEPLYLLWVDDRSLEVLLSPGQKSTKAMRTPSQKYTVTTRILRTTLKSEIAGPTETNTP